MDEDYYRMENERLKRENEELILANGNLARIVSKATMKSPMPCDMKFTFDVEFCSALSDDELMLAFASNLRAIVTRKRHGLGG